MRKSCFAAQPVPGISGRKLIFSSMLSTITWARGQASLGGLEQVQYTYLETTGSLLLGNFTALSGKKGVMLLIVTVYRAEHKKEERKLTLTKENQQNQKKQNKQKKLSDLNSEEMKFVPSLSDGSIDG